MKRFILLILNALVKFLKFFYYRFFSVIKLCVTTQYYSQPSYFPEYADRQKSRIRIFFEQLWNIAKTGYINDFYFCYGFDIKGLKNKSDYVDYSVFRERRNRYLRVSPDIPIAALRNKWIFYLVANQLGIPTPKVYGLLEKGSFFSVEEGKKILIDEMIKQDRDCYCKAVGGECGESVFHLRIKNSEISVNDSVVTIDEFRSLLGKGQYILQQTVTNQAKEISELHSKSINTIRLSTIYNAKTGDIEIFPPLLRVGTHGNPVDNWAKGGLVVEIDFENKCLGKYAYYKVGYGTKVTCHPDSNIVFEGRVIPFFDQAIEKAKFFHSCLPGIHSIGWDIAITDEGPVFIEGNDNWEISLTQISSGGLAKDFNEWFYN